MTRAQLVTFLHEIRRTSEWHGVRKRLRKAAQEFESVTCAGQPVITDEAIAAAWEKAISEVAP